MKFNQSSWNNIIRLRISLSNYAKMVASITAVNGFYALSQKNWIILGINIIFFITAMTTIFSKIKFDKLPTNDEVNYMK